jgi:dihydroxyacetone kinase
MERSIGYQDAGATSVSIIFRAMYDYVGELEAGGQ